MPRGRPTKLTPEVQKQICDAIEAGNYIETAAQYAGIEKSTLYSWLKEGARAKSGKKKEFSNAVKKALAKSEMRDVFIIGKAAEQNWQAAAWRLERKFPDKWGRKEKQTLEHTGKDGGPIETKQHIDLSALSEEELERLESIVRKATRTQGDREGEGQA